MASRITRGNDEEKSTFVPIARPVEEQDADNIPVAVGERVHGPTHVSVVPTAPTLAENTSIIPPPSIMNSRSSSFSSSTAPTMGKTGSLYIPGCGLAVATGGTRFSEEGTVPQRPSASLRNTVLKGGVSNACEGEPVVADGGPVLIACGQGESMYDVKGCVSSWELARGVTAKGETKKVNSFEAGSGSWVLRSKMTAAGEGGIMCSACVPVSDWGEGGALGPRMLITGGKDSVLREWEVSEGRPRLSAELPGHTDWISCCSLLPSTTPGVPPTIAVSGARDGTVRIWSRSSAQANKQGGMAGGGSGRGGWSLASCFSGAHGSSEFVTSSVCPGGRSGAAAGWVATGGTDWTVRLWDVHKMRELGRLSFKGHSRQVTSLAASPDGNMLLSGGEDNKVVVWSPQSRRSIANLQGHESTVNGVAVDQGTGSDPDSGHTPRWVASGGGEGFLFVWDPRNWRTPVATLLGENSHASSSLTASGGGHLAAGAAARFRGESGRWEGETTGATMLNGIKCLAAGGSRDGSGDWLFAAGETTIRAWEMRDGLWFGGGSLPVGGLGGVTSMSLLE